MDTPALLEMGGIGKSFGGVPVLSAVSLTLRAGEVVALLGANGAGKSTLMKILCGAYPRDAGTITLGSEAVRFDRPEDAIAHGVRLLPQEVSVMPNLTVAENIFMGDLPMRRGPLGIPVVDRRRMAAEAGALLAQLGLSLPPDLLVSALSIPERRVVEIARALAGQARVLVMDEPTAALTEPEARLLFDVIAKLRAQNVGVIYISHYLDEVFEISDAIVVLRDGRNAGRFVTSEASREEVLFAMLGQQMEGLYPPVGGEAGAVVLDVRGMSLGGRLDGVTFDVRAGEVLGIFGLIGSGIEVVGRALYGALGPLDGGDVDLDGKSYSPSTPEAAKAAGIGLVAAERKHEGIVPDLSVRENMTLPFLDRFQSRARMDVPGERAHAQRWIEQLGIRAKGPEQAIRFLSGGNQQKVCLARWLVDGIRLLVLEEPTRGVDVGARREIYATLRRLSERGLATIVVSSDSEEVAGLCDRVLVLDRGRVVSRFGAGVTAAALIDAASGMPA